MFFTKMSFPERFSPRGLFEKLSYCRSGSVFFIISILCAFCSLFCFIWLQCRAHKVLRLKQHNSYYIVYIYRILAVYLQVIIYQNPLKSNRYSRVFQGFQILLCINAAFIRFYFLCMNSLDFFFPRLLAEIWEIRKMTTKSYKCFQL